MPCLVILEAHCNIGIQNPIAGKVRDSLGDVLGKLAVMKAKTICTVTTIGRNEASSAEVIAACAPLVSNTCYISSQYFSSETARYRRDRQHLAEVKSKAPRSCCYGVAGNYGFNGTLLRHAVRSCAATPPDAVPGVTVNDSTGVMK